MNTLEKWIEENKLKRLEDWTVKKDGFRIENVIPPVYESYIMLYHPYYIPEKEPLKEGVHTYKPPVLKEISWTELYDFYNLKFDDKASWCTLGEELSSGSYIEGQEMPEQDYFPNSLIQKVQTELLKMNIRQVDINSMSNTLGYQTEIHSISQNIDVNRLNSLADINIIASPIRDWIFINPNDYCRTIVAGNRAFVRAIKASENFEASNFVNHKHRLDRFARIT